MNGDPRRGAGADSFARCAEKFASPGVFLAGVGMQQLQRVWVHHRERQPAPSHSDGGRVALAGLVVKGLVDIYLRSEERRVGKECRL